MVRHYTRESLITMINKLELEWGDEEEAHDLVDLLLQTYTPLEAATWIMFRCEDLLATPIYLIERGKTREVFQYARRMVETAHA